MNPSRKIALFMLAALIPTIGQAAKPKTYSLSSPDGRNVVTISSEGYDISRDGQMLVKGAATALVLQDGSRIGIADSKVAKAGKPVTRTESISAPFYRQKSFTFAYSKLTLEFKDGFRMEWIASDEGVAYRYLTSRKGRTVVLDETAEFSFSDDTRS